MHTKYAVEPDTPGIAKEAMDEMFKVRQPHNAQIEQEIKKAAAQGHVITPDEAMVKIVNMGGGGYRR